MGKTDENVVVDEKPAARLSLPTKASIQKSLKKDPDLGRATEHPIVESNRTLATISGDYSIDIVELEEKVKSMMEKSENRIANGSNSWTSAHKCKVCGKEGLGRNIKDHIEANHLDGVAIPCHSCEKTFRSRRALSIHTKQTHS